MCQGKDREGAWIDEAWQNALYNCPDDILEAEIIRRQKAKKLEETPKLIRNPSSVAPLRPLRDLAESYISQLSEEPAYDDYKIKDIIFEAAIEYFFGKDVWKWVNKRLK